MFILAIAVLIVALIVVGFVTGGIPGALLMAGLGLVLLIPVIVTRGVSFWRPQRRLLRVVRFCLVSVLALATLGILVEGGISIIRVTGDHAEAPLKDRYVVVIVADGASLVQAKELLMGGLDDQADYASALNRNFPNISRLFLNQGAFTANGISVWPSSSIPAHTGIMTGCYPRRTGVMGQRQFSTVNRQYTSYIGLGILAQRDVMSRQVQTLYEYFPRTRSVDVLQVVNRGCSLYVPETPEDEKVVKRVCQVVEGSSALGKLTGKAEVPRVLVVTLPGIDHQTHNTKLSEEKSLNAYLAIDRYVGEIVDTYKRNGLYDKTLFVLCADHGMGEVSNHVTLDNLMRDMRFTTYESLKWSVVPAWGSFEANAYLGTRYRFDHVYNCVPLWGGNSDALLYIKGQQFEGGHIAKENWDLKLTDDQLSDYHVGGTKIDIIQRLLDYSPGIGLIFTNPSPNVFRVYADQGTAEIRERQQDGQLEFQYQVLKGDDPLGYVNNPAIKPFIAQRRWLLDEQWVQLTYLEHYPDAMRRISYSMQHPNAGTMHIVATDGWDFTPYYVAKEVLVGSHGSLNAQHSLVPIMFHGPGVRQVELPYARTVDILPTILTYLGVKPGAVDGRPLQIFTDAQKNAQIADCLPDPAQSTVTDGPYTFALLHEYASYDQRIVRRNTATGEEQIVLPSTKAYYPVLQEKPNAVFKLVGKENGKLAFKMHYLGDARELPQAESITLDR